jgi:hypothetical protein
VPPATDADIEHHRARPDLALEHDLFTGRPLFPGRIGRDDGGIAIGWLGSEIIRPLVRSLNFVHEAFAERMPTFLSAQ